jgi:siderophore synthetase component
MSQDPSAPIRAVAHLLSPAVWTKVNTALIARAIRELAHERLIEPVEVAVEDPWRHYRLAADGDRAEYRFRAQILALDHWLIDVRSLRKRWADGREASLSGMSFFVELRERLGVTEQVLPSYLEEIASTLYAAAYKEAHPGPPAAELAVADFQVIEGGMTEGHPVFVANSGRIGFHAIDHSRYAPEARGEVALIWLAAHERRATFACVADLSYDKLLEQELGPAQLAAFAGLLRGRGLDPDHYRLLPVHPWQWANKIAQLFAADLASGDLVFLGPGEDRHRPQQSIRTLFNLSQPQRRYVKTALSILNMGFHRGISAAITERAAAVNDWVGELVAGDPVLRRLGFQVLREVAFVGYRHRSYEAASARRSDRYKEMLAAQWRESPLPRLQPPERLMTMAALMHVDREGAPVLTELIRASGQSIDAWLAAYLRAYLAPQLHCFFAHDLVFTPHCENVLLVLREHVPVRMILKDIAEDTGLLNPAAPLPERIAHLALRVPEEIATLCIFTDAFDGVFRFLAALLHEHARYPQASFWRLVAACILEYQAAHPHLEARFRRFDLFAPTFARNCLNRLQLTSNQEMIDLNAPDPAASLQFSGTLTNPIASFAPGRAPHPSRSVLHGDR